ncbi:MAG: aldo/keto reductase [Halobacteriales archaeon]|nr:aldo/keto reductase [Halobacteriales archaeon]
MANSNQSDTFTIGGELTVHRLGFGAMRLTGEDIIGPPDDEAAAQRVIKRAIELGIDFIDTSDAYGPGVNERQLGEALDIEGDDVVVATKGGLLRNVDGDWLPHGDPDYLRNAQLCSRDRLGVETIDLYQWHRPDPDVPFEDSINALAELKDDGLIRHVGLSNVDVDQLDRAREIVEIATVQNRYNVEDREHEPVLTACEDHGIGFMPYFPVGAGEFEEKGPALRTIAEAHDATVYQIALAWLLHHSPVMLPIPGTSSFDHLEENIAASAIDLDTDELNRLNA